MIDPSARPRDRAPKAGPTRRIRAAISVESATTGLVFGRLRVAPQHVVFVKGVVEASEGLAGLFAERGGDLRIASPSDREAELHELLHDLAADLGGSVELDAPRAEGALWTSAAPR
jgi:hypothetical protein